ncbi:MAG: malto-oligosyltrehalose synthase, partial [Xanthomonadales bacterium]|nr:malto-oligosyltrehalose synthase [Xanthomonadales bacterium]
QDLADFAASLAVFGLLNSLSQTVLRLTAPGVPDIYQGNEIWDFSLVDPDNRRPVDFDHRERLLSALERRLEEDPDGRARLCAELMDQLADGRAKLYLIRQLLQLRAAQREVFDHGDYLPLTVDGERAEHVCAFARRRGPVTVIVVTGRWFARLQAGDSTEVLPDAVRWGATRIELPAGCGRLRNIFTGTFASATTGSLHVGELLAPLPAAVLIAEG